ncbi:hypothetical protein [Clostridium sp.]|uniref:hypothetical protein n=1 Tax=Clostridium sp. TaxID=1506 RepID=UPI00261701B9|nr:hypothetical protein [Clostridium sp.]
MIKIKDKKITLIDKFKFFFGFPKNAVSDALGISVDTKPRVIAFYLYTVLILILALLKVYVMFSILGRLIVILISLFIFVEILYFIVSKDNKK